MQRIAALLSLLLSGCAAVPPPPVEALAPPELLPLSSSPAAAEFLEQAREHARRGRYVEAVEAGTDALAMMGRRVPPIQLGPEESHARNVEARMHRIIPKVELNAVSLEDAVRYLCAAVNIQDHVDWPALETIGVRRQTRVSLHLRQVPFAAALSAALAQAPGEAAADEPIGFAPHGGLLVISTQKKLDRLAYVVAYDLVELFPPRRIEPGMLGGRPDAANDRFPAGMSYERFAAWVETFLRRTVAPDSWRPGGVLGARCRYVSGALLIRQSRTNHALIRDRLRLVAALVGASGAGGGSDGPMGLRPGDR